MAEVHAGTGRLTAQHALLTTVIALAVALLVGAGAVILYYEVIDSDVVPTLTQPEPVVHVVTPEQVAAARAIDKREAERNIVVIPPADNPLAGSPARTESMGVIPTAKK